LILIPLKEQGMDVQEFRKVRRNLDRFLERFDDCIKTKPSRRHLRVYSGGQVSDLDRKSVEPMALEAGVPPRTLQKFLEEHRWDEQAVRRRVQQIVGQDHGDPNGIGVIDETGMPKKGDKTVGVQRQYCGSTGKKDNCVVTVNLGYVAGDFHALIDAELYLPDETWHQNRARCRAAGVPDDVVYRPKWQIGLDLLDRAMDHGVPLKYATADELYGQVGAFRQGLTARGLIYVLEVPRTMLGWTQKPRVLEPNQHQGTGRPRTKPFLAAGAKPPRRVEALWKRGGPKWQKFHIKNTDKGPVVWEVRTSRFWIARAGLPAEECRLLVARNVLDGEVKYFVSNAPPELPTEVLLHVAFSRWHIERLYEDGKGEIGLDHFEVRKYRPFMRHLIVSLVSLLFLLKETDRLRSQTPPVDGAASASRDRSAA
jgi:SRSO17 transposase